MSNPVKTVAVDSVVLIVPTIASRGKKMPRASLRRNGTDTAAIRKNMPAKIARQKANIIPLDSVGQESKIGAFANNPLVLHMTAANKIIKRFLKKLVAVFHF